MCVFFLFLIIRALITFSLDLSVSLSPSISLRSCVVSPSLLRVFIPTHTQTHTLSLYILFSAISLSKALAQIRTSRRWLSSKGIKVHTARTTPTQFSFSLSLYLKEKELYFGVLFFFVFLPAIGNYVWGEKEGFWIRFWVLVLCGGSACDVGVLSNARVNLFLLKPRGVVWI